MPALVNIRVGSFLGTSEDEATGWWPFAAKKSMKCDRMSLTPLMNPLLTRPEKPYAASG
jgi:hypothetical protein